MSKGFIAKGKDDVLTRVVLEQYGTRYVSESIYSDEDTVEELLRLVSGALIAHSWSVSQVAEALHNFANELNYEDRWIPEGDPTIVDDEDDGRRWVKDTDHTYDEDYDEPSCTIDDLEGDEPIKEEPLDLELDDVVSDEKQKNCDDCGSIFVVTSQDPSKFIPFDEFVSSPDEDAVKSPRKEVFGHPYPGYVSSITADVNKEDTAKKIKG